MDGRPDGFGRNESEDRPEQDDDNELSALLKSLPPCPGIPSTPEEIAASDARARADFKAGRVIPHEQVATWFKTWGTTEFKPMPREWLE